MGAFVALMLLWNQWQLRALMLLSFSLQLFLLLAGSSRRRHKSATLRVSLWLAFLLADLVATFALGVLSHQFQCVDSGAQLSMNQQLVLFWAPFVLVHLGGQDNMTAFSVEDNALWHRHALSVVVQSWLAVYAFRKSLHSSRLIAPAALMFVVGITHYIGRTWALRSASMATLRSSMRDKSASLADFIKTKKGGAIRRLGDIEAGGIGDSYSYYGIIWYAFNFFQRFQRIFADVMILKKDLDESRSFFLNKLSPAEAYRVVALELSLAYDLFYTKMPVLHTWYGILLRAITLLTTITALVLFAVSNKNGYSRPDLLVTWVLLGGALSIEIAGALQIIFSIWAFYPFAERLGNSCCPLDDFVLYVMRFFCPEDKSRWSNTMGQCNLIDFCYKDVPFPKWITKILMKLGAIEFWDRHYNTYYIRVPDGVQDLIFNQLEQKSRALTNLEDSRSYYHDRGHWAIKHFNIEVNDTLKASLGGNFDECILQWHIATDICDHLDREGTPNTNMKASRVLSNYMLHLLISSPEMVAARVRQALFVETYADAKLLFGLADEEVVYGPKTSNYHLLLDPSQVTQWTEAQHGASVVEKASALAAVLTAMEEPEQRWELISAVWVGILCHAAGRCKGELHARNLSRGGELLTHVWLLSAHLGIGDHFKDAVFPTEEVRLEVAPAPPVHPEGTPDSTRKRSRLFPCCTTPPEVQA